MGNINPENVRAKSFLKSTEQSYERQIANLKNQRLINFKETTDSVGSVKGGEIVIKTSLIEALGRIHTYFGRKCMK